MKPRACAGRWRQLALLAVAVLAVHLALLQGDGPDLRPVRDRGVQHFTARTVPPAAVAAVAAPNAGVPGGTARLRRPAPPAAALPPVATSPPIPSPRRLAVSAANPSPAPSALPEPPAPAPAPEPAPAVTPFAPQHLAAPPSAVLHYDVSLHVRGFTLSGRARLDWRHDGQHYELRMEVASPGLRARVQQSTGRLTGDGLAPERFSDKSRSEQAVHFDRAGGRVIFSNNRPEAALAPGMQDRLSVVLQLSMLVAADPARFAPGTQIAIPTASTREAEDWIFRVEGEEDLDLPGGQVRALRLLRLPRKEFDQKVELWLAPGQAYAPVRLRLTNPDGGWVDQRWSSTDRR